MKAESQEAFDQLVGSIDELIKIYRALLKVVRKEKEILASANLDELNENNRTKEQLLVRSRGVESKRGKWAVQLANSEGISTEGLRLESFAIHFGDANGERLRNMQSVLKILLERVRKINSENEVLVQSALSNINGAMKAIRDSLVKNKTYQKKGEVSGEKTQSGHLVSREV